MLRRIESRNSLKTLKFRNRKTVLSFMRGGGALSVNEISQATNLSKMTIHKILDHYLEEGMITHAGKGFSTEEGGKKPNLFSFNAACRYIFTIRLRADALLTTVVNLKGEMMAPIMESSLKGVSFTGAIGLMGEMFRRQTEESRLPLEDCLAVVVGCDGIVDPATGICVAAYHSPGWDRNLPLQESLQAVVPEHIPIHIDSWWRYLAYGEIHFSEGRTGNRFFLLGNSGEYLSGGLVADGVADSGSGAFAGEVGHLVVDPASDRRCVCGGSGCLESRVAPGRVLESIFSARDRHPDSRLFQILRPDSPMDFARLAEAADDGDALAGEILDGVARDFTVAINNIIQICDPGIVVLYGDYALAGESLLGRIREKLASLTLCGIDKRTEIVSAVLGDEHGVVGAANHMTDALFSGGR